MTVQRNSREMRLGAHDAASGPSGAELIAPGGELANKVEKVVVVWVAPGFDAQQRDGAVGGFLAVGVEVTRAWVEEGE